MPKYECGVCGAKLRAAGNSMYVCPKCDATYPAGTVP